ncbi:hypothetical protein CB0101_12975 [Synechococcus sp. CB0101]|uniref:aspartate aminotransferase n=1 Tax=Synechococcus sp. CB0101 TaxID=232348 RepID=UPI000200194A|nr:aspartate aminotransferase [Synechococcus sp. CB0101]QCH15703.1 hypothetical protein CB0101_12975 [Synechococcus sp. CB0101]
MKPAAAARRLSLVQQPVIPAMEQLIRQYRVALVSGSSFGLEGCCLRLSYGMLGSADLSEALQRLVKGLWALSRS